MTTTTFIISDKVYEIITHHASKYPWTTIIGVLLAEKSTLSSGKIRISHAIPLLHHWTTLSPILQTGLRMISIYANKNDLEIMGIYVGNERLTDKSLSPISIKILSKLRQINSNIFALVMDNEKFSISKPTNILIPYIFQENSWSRVKNAFLTESTKPLFLLENKNSPENSAKSIKLDHFTSLIDFDDHLENPSLTWLP